MLKNEQIAQDWKTALTLMVSRQALTMLFLGFSAGIPLALIFSSLSLWLSEAGISKSTVTYFSWAGLAFSFKFVWAPLVDRLPIPVLSKLLGRRRSWLLTAQIFIIIAISLIGLTDPMSSEDMLVRMAYLAILLGISAATQDIIIDAYRIEFADSSMQGILSSSYIAGYRLGMIASGAGALLLAAHWGSTKNLYSYEAWQYTYLTMACLMLVGVVTTFIIKEPKVSEKLRPQYSNMQYVRFFIFFIVSINILVFTYISLSDISLALKSIMGEFLGNKVLANFLIEALQLLTSFVSVIIFSLLINRFGLMEKALVRENYWLPVSDFFQRYGTKLALLLLAFIGFYRVSDIVLGVIANVFYQDMGFTKDEIATVAKTFGLVMMIAGGFIGGIFSVKFGVMKVLFIGAVLTVSTNLMFMLLAHSGHDIVLLYIVISADNLSAGIASAAFIAFLSSITNVSFTAVQYAIFSSLMTLVPKLIGGYSGSMVENLGYYNFFLIASLMGVPVLYLIYLLNKKMALKE
ncbi:AmpG family muropeptide MFS transporter [Aliikangiella sp. IMCC44359]|uniref:AmpG family muropeptide MFS transporter n=1 Tax=Aliikangiella sp. IMCC44359 TaxID=3459125 RepID=UPI00403AFDC2